LYTAQETGYIALQCPEHEHYHVQSECVRVEILDERNRPCATGQTGRVVLTPLHGFAMPLLRYAIGDYAEVGAPCRCGRGLPVLARILGRVRNMLTLPDGSQRWPSLAFFGGTTAEAVKQYQCVQTRLGEIELRLVVARALTPAEEARLRAKVAEVLGHPFTVTLTYHQSIPRSAGGKFEQFVSRLGG
jgi:phenylacetate-CoA ligase